MQAAVPKGKGAATDLPFHPSAATASLLLYTQGSTVLCLHHDTLAVERRFQKHADDIQLIAVDNVSETGAGRLVVTYDRKQTAIVWDLFTGEQLSRFASYEPLKVASWMRNGNIAFGNGKGEVILFEPATSEHVSARTIFDPITAIGPAADCKTYAIGYNNGSILLASLQPTFTILHTLMTSRAPSPISSLTWHASSSKQKSDMLATLTADGDLRVWSVSKPPTSEAPRVIRVLRRPDPTFLLGRTWISWSKNGRIIQYSETETCTWDVRTKHVTFEPLPVIDGVRALAAYGPTATLFTLGPDHTVQQYDAENRQLVRNVRIVPTNLPPTPPEENRPWTTSESEDDFRSPSRISRPDPDGFEYSRNRVASPVSHPSNQTVSHVPKKSRGKDVISPAVRSELTGTSFSVGTNYYLESQKYSSPQSARSRKPSRLKQEVTMSPHERPIDDLFPFIRARLSDVPYRPPRTDNDRMTPDDLRNQMLSTVFGWEDDISDLIRDELSRHPVDGQHAIILSRWLDDDPDFLTGVLGATGAISNIDWMILALGTLDDSASAKKVCQVFVEKMLSRGDIHAAATVLLAIGDKSDAIEVYVSRNQFLEAVLLTCLVTPTDWQRQSHLVRRWGEHVVEKSEQQLAIRCFSCTSVEPTEPWTSPTAQMAVQSAGGILSNPMQIATPLVSVGNYPDIYAKTMQRRSRTLDNPISISMPPPPAAAPESAGSGVGSQTSALKLITSFGPSEVQKYKFPGLKSDDHTPTHGATVTPIAESAIDRSALSPGGTGSYRLNNIRSLNTAMSARTPSGYHRQRLPSIGETPIDVESPRISTLRGKSFTHANLPNQACSAHEHGRNMKANQSQDSSAVHAALTMLPSAKYEPSSTPVQETPQTALPQTAVKTTYQPRRFSGNESIGLTVDDGQSRGSSRSRKPDGLSIQMYPVNEVSKSSSKLTNTSDSYQTTQFESASDLVSPPVTGETFRSGKSPSVSGKSIDQYISSLEQAQLYSHNARSRGQSSSGKHREEKRSRHGQNAASEDLRGREDKRAIPAAKRSPSSPVPMSPEDVRMFSLSTESIDSAYASSRSGVPRTGTPLSHSGMSRRHSRSGKENRNRSKSAHKKAGSRAVSPNPSQHSYRSRGRSESRREESGRRSPSSPLPMVPSEEDRNSATESVLRFVHADRRNRSTSAQPSYETEVRREPSPGQRKPRTRSGSRQREERDSVSRRSSISTRGDKSRRRRDASNARSERIAGLTKLMIDPQTGNESQETGEVSANPSLSDRKKELAAAELEARRLSLVRRPSAPNIPLPGQNGFHSKSSSESAAPPLQRSTTEDILTSKVYEDSRPRRTSTPRAIQILPYPPPESITDASDTNDTLPSSVYLTPNPDADSLPLPSLPPQRTQADLEVLKTQLPRHPAYDTKISQSRSHSNTREPREHSRNRHPSRDRSRNTESFALNMSSPESINTHSGRGRPPPLLPELQHLAEPPVPPPPPSAPQTAPLELRQTTQLDPDYLAKLPRANSSNTNRRPTSPASGNGHRRGRSGNDSLANKFKSMADRMRSTSRGRDHLTRSPPMVQEVGPMPYETDTGTGRPVLVQGRI